MTSPDVARALLRVGAVTLRPDDPFTWASGRRAPIYCDNRVALAHPDVRRALADALAEAARAHAPDAIAGVATAGIPWAALVAERLGLPLCYVRSAAKAHGQGQRIEGQVRPGERTVLVEDLVSTGGSVLAAADALREAGAVPLAALAVFTYGLAGVAGTFRDAGLPLATLTDFGALAAVARDDGALAAEALDALAAWQADPSAWSAARGGAS